jgi:hypothetical protein
MRYQLLGLLSLLLAVWPARLVVPPASFQATAWPLGNEMPGTDSSSKGLLSGGGRGSPLAEGITVIKLRKYHLGQQCLHGCEFARWSSETHHHQSKPITH